MDQFAGLEGQLKDYHQRCCENEQIAKGNAKSVAKALVAIETARSSVFSVEEQNKAIGEIAYNCEISGFLDYLDSAAEPNTFMEDT